MTKPKQKKTNKNDHGTQKRLTANVRAATAAEETSKTDVVMVLAREDISGGRE